MSPDELERFGDEIADERRGKGVDRDRISTLAKHFARIARNLDARERRVERAIRVLQAGGLLLIVVGAIGYFALREQARETDRVAAQTKQALSRARAVAREQARSRYRGNFTACLERNRTNDGIVRYLRRLGASPKEIRQAREFFPNQPNCKAYTIALLGKNPPKGAFDLPRVLKDRTRRPK